MRAPISPAVGPTIRLNPASSAPAAPAATNTVRDPQPAARPNVLRAVVPLVGLLFGVAVVLGLAQLFALNGLRAVTLWPIFVLLGGVLLSESAWVNGQLWRGLRGMLLWGGLIGLMAFGRLMPWALALALGWLALHPGWYGRHT